MIQRIQSLYLLIVAVLAALMYFFVFLTIQSPDLLWFNKPVVTAAFCLMITLASIFMYKKRKMQIKFCYINIIFFLLVYAEIFIGAIMTIDFDMTKIKYHFGIASIIPPVCVIFILLAIRAIKKDENLVKSLDRIR